MLVPPKQQRQDGIARLVRLAARKADYGVLSLSQTQRDLAVPRWAFRMHGWLISHGSQDDMESTKAISGC